jgi:hypothetical protein
MTIAVAGADFDDTAMVISVGVNQHSLRMRPLEHLFQVCGKQRPVEVILRCVPGGQLRVWLSDAHNLNFRIVKRLLEEALDVPVNQANDAHAERRAVLRVGGLGGAMCCCEAKRKDVSQR